MHEGVRELISGSVGGIVSTVAGHPLDTIKTRVQAFPHLYRNSVHCCLKIIRTEGPRALGKGLLPPVMAQAGMNSILFASEGTVRRSLQQLKLNTSVEKFIAGAASGLIVSVVETPFELVKTQLQQTGIGSRGKQPSTWSKVLEMKRRVGLQKLYTGFGAVLIRNVPSYGVFFFVYFHASKLFQANGCGALSELLAGAVTGLVSWTVCFPADVVKTRIQSDPLGDRRFPTWFGYVKDIYKNEGMKTFTRGLAPCLIRSVPVCGVLFYVQERIESSRRLFFRRNEESIQQNYTDKLLQ